MKVIIVIRTIPVYTILNRAARTLYSLVDWLDPYVVLQVLVVLHDITQKDIRASLRRRDEDCQSAHLAFRDGIVGEDLHRVKLLDLFIVVKTGDKGGDMNLLPIPVITLYDHPRRIVI